MVSVPATSPFLETVMRFTPAAVLLASVLALSASSSLGQKTDTKAPVDSNAPPVTLLKPQFASPQTAEWAARGAAALESGDLATARNAYETALLLSPGDARLYFALGKIARAEKLPGRAIKYFSDARRLDPQNQAAIQQEGLAMMDKGAIESARQTLAELKASCKAECPLAAPLAAAIAAGPPKIQTADASDAEKNGAAAKN